MFPLFLGRAPGSRLALRMRCCGDGWPAPPLHMASSRMSGVNRVKAMVKVIRDPLVLFQVLEIYKDADEYCPTLVGNPTLWSGGDLPASSTWNLTCQRNGFFERKMVQTRTSRRRWAAGRWNPNHPQSQYGPYRAHGLRT